MLSNTITLGMEIQKAGNAPHASPNEGGESGWRDGSTPTLPPRETVWDTPLRHRSRRNAISPFGSAGNVGSFSEEPIPGTMARRRIGGAWGRDFRYAEGKRMWRIESATH